MESVQSLCCLGPVGSRPSRNRVADQSATSDQRLGEIGADRNQERYVSPDNTTKRRLDPNSVSKSTDGGKPLLEGASSRKRVMKSYKSPAPVSAKMSAAKSGTKAGVSVSNSII